MTKTELFPGFVSYHQTGDANIEGRCLSNICDKLVLNTEDRFRVAYYYSTCYNIDSALRLFENPRLSVNDVVLRTDRRYVRCHEAFPKIMAGCDKAKLEALSKTTTFKDAIDTVEDWFFFGRYATFLFLETYYALINPDWDDNAVFDWEPDENYTLGAKTLIRETDNRSLDSLLEELKLTPTDRNNSNSFAIETGLCGWWKILKGTRWNGYYAERMIDEAVNSRYRNLILSCID